VFDLRPDDVWTLFHSYCFDFSVWEMWGAFTHGATLVVISAEAARDPEAMVAEIRAHRVTVLNQVPSVFRYLSRAGSAELDSLRYVIFGGEPVDIMRSSGGVPNAGGTPSLSTCTASPRQRCSPLTTA